MPSAVPKPFQVLALSGGGFRGLYTAKVIADVERDIGAPREITVPDTPATTLDSGLRAADLESARRR